MLQDEHGKLFGFSLHNKTLAHTNNLMYNYLHNEISNK